MVLALRSLGPSELRQLLSLLDPASLSPDERDGDLLDLLRRVLRRVLEVPVDSDLGEYIRRRLGETVRDHFQMTAATDLRTDLELADDLVTFVLDAATRLADDDESRRDFETFLRTKDRTERIRWLVTSKESAALATAKAWDSVSSREAAERLQERPAAHRLTAKAILDDLAAVASTRQGAGGVVVGAAGVSAVTALPLGALAGGLFMAGRTVKNVRDSATAREASREVQAAERKQRARRSTLVQAVVILSAVALAQQNDLTATKQ
jgi:hypothetical protein